MVITNTSLEVLRECSYIRNDDLGAMVSNNLYLSVIATNACQRNCPYCINSLTDRSLSLPFEKGTKNILKATKKFGIKEAVILGGEPTLYPRLIDLINFLKNDCKLRRVGFTTNGIRLVDDRYLISLIESDVDFINVSYHQDDEFISYKELKHIRKVFNEHKRDNQKMRINTNVWKGNHDKFADLLSWLDHISVCCDEIRLSNIIHKDSFSVNPDKVDEADKMYMSDTTYEKLFSKLIDYYKKDYTIIYNPEALGFVNYYLIPKPVPIIVNWNIDSKVSEQICENDIANKKIHTVKCIVTGDISLSWNTGNVVDLD
jgi:molybdenum cofactor biosynthesis enzyme MoaA